MKITKEKLSDVIVIASILTGLISIISAVILIDDVWIILLIFTTAAFLSIIFSKGVGTKGEHTAGLIISVIIGLIFMKTFRFVLLMPGIFAVYLVVGIVVDHVDGILKIDRTFRCPECRSDKVTFLSQAKDNPPDVGKPVRASKWECGGCGHIWEERQP